LSHAIPSLRGFKGTVIVVNGDTPLIQPTNLKKFLSLHKKNKNNISILSFISQEPRSYGRIIRNQKGEVISIVEDQDATTIQKKVHEVNSGVYAIESQALSLLKNIQLNKLKKEYYLTDIVHIAKKKDLAVGAFCFASEDEFTGVNTMKEFEKAKHLLKRRIIQKFQNQGVNFLDTESVFISSTVYISKNTVIYPNVHLEGDTYIGKGCTIYPNVRILDSIIEDGVIIKDSTLIEGSVVRKKALIGPFAHIRPLSVIGSETKIGNFVEVKKTVIGTGTKACHLTYLGDAKVGKDVNIGAGTITCNYDGYKKNITIIKDKVFIGSNTQLIAPVTIGKAAYIGAGSTITQDVPSQALAISRLKQRNIEGWVQARQKRVKKKINKKKGLSKQKG
jgi:bifunctional UDP-N-acetylglucosamine pyrophosphorylase/glucosamine-1-phosphate N-acetyltransferase